MDGIINLHKPVGITSAKALYRVRAITRQRKSGHAGTLDPAASGVLVLCLGKATKLVEQLMDQPKVYRAAARLDVTSESFDSDRPLVPVPCEAPSDDQIREVLASFQGQVDQVPPAISAIKVGGRPAYKRASGQVPPQLSPRCVRIDWIRLHAYDWPALDFELACGRGTYVRSLIRDVGARLRTGGCLTALARLRVGPFTLEDAWTIERLSAARPDDYLIPLERAVAMLAGQPPSLQEEALGVSIR